MASAREKLGCKTTENVKVYFQDEGRFGRMSDPVSCWAPKPMRPGLPLQRIREYTYAYSSICPEDGDLFSLILPYSDTDVMQIYINEFSKHLKGQKAILIMDQAPWHKAGRLTSTENILITFLPPYSPELNPVEHLWKHLREKYMSNRYWENMEKLEDDLCHALQEASNDKNTIKSISLFNWMVDV